MGPLRQGKSWKRAVLAGVAVALASAAPLKGIDGEEKGKQEERPYVRMSAEELRAEYDRLQEEKLRIEERQASLEALIEQRSAPVRMEPAAAPLVEAPAGRLSGKVAGTFSYQNGRIALSESARAMSTTRSPTPSPRTCWA